MSNKTVFKTYLRKMHFSLPILLACFVCLVILVQGTRIGWFADYALYTFTSMFASNAEYKFDGFYKSSTVEQSIKFRESTNFKIEDQNGIDVITPESPDDPAVIVLTMKKEYNDYVFFPRVTQGAQVFVIESTPREVLFHLEGQSAWTPMARRYFINLRHSKYGFEDKQIELSIKVVLCGKDAQLWLPGGKVFFR